MKAAILVKQNAPVVVGEVEIPKLEVSQVWAKIDYASICGKQIDAITAKRGDDSFLPNLVGHEGAGVVVQVCAGVT